MSYPSDQSDSSDLANFLKTAPPEAAANTLLCLINQASYLLRRQIARLEQDFLKHDAIRWPSWRFQKETRAIRPWEIEGFRRGGRGPGVFFTQALYDVSPPSRRDGPEGSDALPSPRALKRRERRAPGARR